MPVFFGIPLFLEFADIAAKFPEKGEAFITFLTTSEFMLFIMGYSTYIFMQKMITGITYNTETDKVTFH